MLAKKYRFHGYGSLRFLYSRGTMVRNRYFGLKFVKNNRREDSRLAVVVAKKVSKKAPVRNRLRRRLYEVMRQHWSMIQPGNDLLITVFDGRIEELSHAELNKLVVEMLHKAELYKS